MLQKKLVPRQLRILVVEDHDLLRKLFHAAFRETHIVYTASNAKEGWDLYLNNTPDIVFLDINLPDASGHALANRIKIENPAVHVIMATSSDYTADAEQAQKNHVDGFIVKPFNKEKIGEYIDRYIAAYPQGS